LQNEKLNVIKRNLIKIIIIFVFFFALLILFCIEIFLDFKQELLSSTFKSDLRQYFSILWRKCFKNHISKDCIENTRNFSRYKICYERKYENMKWNMRINYFKSIVSCLFEWNGDHLSHVYNYFFLYINNYAFDSYKLFRFSTISFPFNEK
jgi:hypothetical protein